MPPKYGTPRWNGIPKLPPISPELGGDLDWVDEIAPGISVSKRNQKKIAGIKRRGTKSPDSKQPSNVTFDDQFAAALAGTGGVPTENPQAMQAPEEGDDTPAPASDPELYDLLARQFSPIQGTGLAESYVNEGTILPAIRAALEGHTQQPPSFLANESPEETSSFDDDFAASLSQEDTLETNSGSFDDDFAENLIQPGEETALAETSELEALLPEPALVNDFGQGGPSFEPGQEIAQAVGINPQDIINAQAAGGAGDYTPGLDYAWKALSGLNYPNSKKNLFLNTVTKNSVAYTEGGMLAAPALGKAFQDAWKAVARERGNLRDVPLQDFTEFLIPNFNKLYSQLQIFKTPGALPTPGTIGQMTRPMKVTVNGKEQTYFVKDNDLQRFAGFTGYGLASGLAETLKAGGLQRASDQIYNAIGRMDKAQVDSLRNSWVPADKISDFLIDFATDPLNLVNKITGAAKTGILKPFPWLADRAETINRTTQMARNADQRVDNFRGAKGLMGPVQDEAQRLLTPGQARAVKPVLGTLAWATNKSALAIQKRLQSAKVVGSDAYEARRLAEIAEVRIGKEVNDVAGIVSGIRDRQKHWAKVDQEIGKDFDKWAFLYADAGANKHNPYTYVPGQDELKYFKIAQTRGPVEASKAKMLDALDKDVTEKISNRVETEAQALISQGHTPDEAYSLVEPTRLRLQQQLGNFVHEVKQAGSRVRNKEDVFGKTMRTYGLLHPEAYNDLRGSHIRYFYNTGRYEAHGVLDGIEQLGSGKKTFNTDLLKHRGIEKKVNDDGVRVTSKGEELIQSSIYSHGKGGVMAARGTGILSLHDKLRVKFGIRDPELDPLLNFEIHPKNAGEYVKVKRKIAAIDEEYPHELDDYLAVGEPFTFKGYTDPDTGVEASRLPGIVSEINLDPERKQWNSFSFFEPEAVENADGIAKISSKHNPNKEFHVERLDGEHDPLVRVTHKISGEAQEVKLSELGIETQSRVNRRLTGEPRHPVIKDQGKPNTPGVDPLDTSREYARAMTTNLRGEIQLLEEAKDKIIAGPDWLHDPTPKWKKIEDINRQIASNKGMLEEYDLFSKFAQTEPGKTREYIAKRTGELSKLIEERSRKIEAYQDIPFKDLTPQQKAALKRLENNQDKAMAEVEVLQQRLEQHSKLLDEADSAGKLLSNALESSKDGRSALINRDDYVLLKGDKWGTLNGHWVPKHVEQMLANRYGDKIYLGENMKIFRSVVSGIKFLKTVANPATWANNIFGNFVLADAGANIEGYKLLPEHYFAADQEFLKGRGHWMDEMNSVSTALSQYSEGLDAIGGAMKGVGVEGTVPAKTAIGKGVQGIQQGAEFLGGKYQQTEQFSKLSLYICFRKNGVEPYEAARLAQHYLFDYSDVNQYVDIARRYGFVPFATFPLKATEILGEALVKNPSVINRWNILQGHAFKMDPEYEKQYQELAEGRYYTTGKIMLPVGKDKKGKAIFLDVSNKLPWGTFGDPGNPVGGNPAGMLANSFIMGAPTGAIMKSGVPDPRGIFDPKFQRPVNKGFNRNPNLSDLEPLPPGMPENEQWRQQLGAIGQTYLPPLLPPFMSNPQGATLSPQGLRLQRGFEGLASSPSKYSPKQSALFAVAQSVFGIALYEPYGANSPEAGDIHASKIEENTPIYERSDKEARDKFELPQIEAAVKAGTLSRKRADEIRRSQEVEKSNPAHYELGRKLLADAFNSPAARKLAETQFPYLKELPYAELQRRNREALKYLNNSVYVDTSVPVPERARKMRNQMSYLLSLQLRMAELTQQGR